MKLRIMFLGLLFAGCQTPATSASRTVREWGGLPLRFEANQGQLDGRVRYLARQGGMSLALTDRGAELLLRDSSGARSSGGGATMIRMRVHDALATARMVPGAKLVACRRLGDNLAFSVARVEPELIALLESERPPGCAWYSSVAF